MYAFSDWIISLFEKNGIVLKHNRSTYVYGLDIFLYTILSTAGLLLIGYVSHHFYESILLIILWAFIGLRLLVCHWLIRF